MKFVRCNMCKKEIPTRGSGYYELHIRQSDPFALDMGETDYEGDLDICKECIQKLDDFANGLKVVYF